VVSTAEKSLTAYEDLTFGPIAEGSPVEANAGEGELAALVFFEGPIDFTLAE